MRGHNLRAPLGHDGLARCAVRGHRVLFICLHVFVGTYYRVGYSAGAGMGKVRPGKLGQEFEFGERVQLAAPSATTRAEARTRKHEISQVVAARCPTVETN